MANQLRIFVTFIMLLCVCLKQIKGSCLSYGHSCWGAHGKRAGGPSGRTTSSDGPSAVQFQPQQLLDQSNPLPASLTGAERWALVRVLPEKNAYYPFGKLIYPPSAMASTTYVYSDGSASSGTESTRIGSESTNNAEGRLVDISYDSKPQASTEQDIAPGDDRLITAVAYSNLQRKDHRHKKKPQSLATHRRFSSSADSFEDNSNIARILPNDDDISQILLLNAAAAAAATLSDNDVSLPNSHLNRKLFTDTNKNSIMLNA